MKIIVADQRLTEPRGVKALIVGPTGVGKTSLLRTLDPARVLFVDSEAGDLAVQDYGSIPSGLTTGRRRATWRAGSAGQIHLFRRPLVTQRHTSKPSGDRSKILVDTTLFSSIASPRSAGCRFAGRSSSRRHDPSVPAPRTYAVPTASMPEKC